MYKCKYCNKDFDKPQKLGGHVIWCKQNPNKNGKSGFSVYNKTLKHQKQKRKYNEPQDNLFCQFCNKQCKTLNSLKQHEMRCNQNLERIPLNNLAVHNEQIKLQQKNVWNKGLNKNINESVKQQSLSLHNVYASGKLQPYNKGITHSEEFKRAVSKTMRIKTAEYLEKCYPNGRRYNKNACLFIEKLNKEKGWKLQHAENGGEVKVCGFFLDGYDKENNIVFEYDERAHYIDVDKNILRVKDIKRQDIIKEKLQCRFFRYNEYTDTLYEI